MTGISRKIERRKKKLAEKDLSDKTKLMGDLSSECLACELPFDKTNKEQVATWRVVVRERQKKVNLYCPDCWDSALQLLKEIKKDLKK